MSSAPTWRTTTVRGRTGRSRSPLRPANRLRRRSVSGKTDSATVFLVARNPQPDSRLPYLVRLPLGEGLVLKARAPWPATARVYCHRFEDPWPEDAEIVDEALVLVWRRRGPAVDLVLDRRQARSQFVFTEAKGREPIFWQTQKTARAANPGGRVRADAPSPSR